MNSEDHTRQETSPLNDNEVTRALDALEQIRAVHTEDPSGRFMRKTVAGEVSVWFGHYERRGPGTGKLVAVLSEREYDYLVGEDHLIDDLQGFGFKLKARAKRNDT